MNYTGIEYIGLALKHKDYAHFVQEYSVNIIGVRASERSAGRFDDYIILKYWAGDEWAFFSFPATTDPGGYYLENPMNVRGTAILKPGQYRQAFAIGTHRGYPALVQVEPVTVYRDGNRDGNLDIENAPEDTGMFGIHIHHAGAVPSKKVGRWSAGCQVFQDAAHFDFFMQIVKKSMRRYGPRVTYTLLDEDDLPQTRWFFPT